MEIGKTMLMNEEQYFEKSRNKKLPLRCPILGKCERYAMTVYYLSELYIHGQGNSLEGKLKNWVSLSENFEKERISQVGEMFNFSKSKITCSFSKACPEVSLFNNELIYSFIPKKAITSGFWDDFCSDTQYGEDGKFRIHKLGHFSGCSEFSQFQYARTKGNSNTRKTRRRVPISKKLRFEIFQRDNFSCQYCKRNKDEDGVKLQIDHITPVSEGGTDEIDNLITSCEDCNQGKSNKIIRK